ncbi:MAG: 50S ribosomal protein L6 [Bacteroidetes bacterium]|nr:50S ribosomal protein L6 [Bacteroidota bacterium]
MSRLGNRPVGILQGVKVQLQNNLIQVIGPKGQLVANISPKILVEISEKEVSIKRSNDNKFEKALHGTTRAIVSNMIKGVTEGYTKKLELVGVGYRAEMKGKVLVLQLGFSHPIVFKSPEEITITTPTQTNIIITGVDKQLVGLVAAKIRSFRQPEPYKGKGVKYDTEIIRRKAGKTAATAGK